MKKVILSIILILMILFSLVNVVFAAPEFTQEQAKELLIEAYQRFRMIQDGRTSPYESKYLKEDYVKVDATLQMCTIFDTKGDGSKYNDTELPQRLDYVPIIDERFNTIEKCYLYLEEIYTEQWADILIKHNYFYSTEKDVVESIRLSNGGKFYNNSDTTADSFELWKDDIPMILYATGSMYYSKNLGDIGDLKVDANKAELNVTLVELKLISCDGVIPDGAVPKFPLSEGQEKAYFLFSHDRTVTFSYTSDGWRISGGSFFDDMLNINVPATGDESAYKIPALTVAALISVALPVSLLKKRRVSE